ncbi:ERCC4-type nuclease [Methylocaldum marinum]|uniref:ERCC4-type nuclease n=1 Tax=Methylocaldum marinum TaxID=1432792 RepID=A0A286P3S5_9GAMM|nr:ERCC4 domain-containing protein [Methylocaldum marinum]BBA32297.1 ERCC4-type nuclease [Methylocaldum marinum]
MTLIQAVVDDREPDGAILDALRNMSDVQVTIRRLELGDYELDGCLLFERKTLRDLIASIQDGRLFRQACRLASSPMCKALILEGTSRDLLGGGMRREAVQGVLIHLTLFLGIPLLRSTDPAESARLMIYAARQFESILRGTSPRLFKGKLRTQLQILLALPGIGPEYAARLLETFGSVEANFNAKVHDLMRVPGVGNARARAIRWAVSEQLSLYSKRDDPVL